MPGYLVSLVVRAFINLFLDVLSYIWKIIDSLWFFEYTLDSLIFSRFNIVLVVEDTASYIFRKVNSFIYKDDPVFNGDYGFYRRPL
jgi:hypothetical protein